MKEAELAAINKIAARRRKAERARLAALRKIQVMNRGIAVAGIAAGAIALRAMAGAIKGIIQAAGKFEQVNVAFEVMFGSVELAKRKLEELQDFATRTPFTLPGVEAAARSLVAVGFTAEELLPTLKTLGDISAGLGRGEEGLRRLILNLGQVKAQAKLTGRELRDFAILGVPILESLADILGKNVAEIQQLTQAGEISSDLVIQAFENMTKEGGRFNNLMEKMNRTAFGLFSNLKDEITLVQREIGGALLPVIRDVLNLLIKVSRVIREIVEANRGAVVGGIIGVGVAALVLSLAAAYTLLGVAAAIAGVSVGALAIAIGSFLAIPALVAIIAVSFGILIGSIVEATSEIKGLKATTEAWTNKLAEANIELKKGTKNLKDFSQEGSKASQNLGGFINALRKIVDIGERRKGINQLISADRGVLALNELVANAKKSSKQFGTVISGMLQDLRRLILFRAKSGPTNLDLSKVGRIALERLQRQFGEVEDSDRVSDKVLAAFEKQIRAGAIGLVSKSFIESTESLDEFIKKAKDLADPVSALVRMRDELIANKKVLEEMAAAPKGTFPEFKDFPGLIDKTNKAIGFSIALLNKAAVATVQQLENQLALLRGEKTRLDIIREELKLMGVGEDIIKRRLALEKEVVKEKQKQKDLEKGLKGEKQRRVKRDEAALGVFDRTRTPLETFRKNVAELKKLREKGPQGVRAISAETLRRALKGELEALADAILSARKSGPKPLLEAGRSGFREFGKKIQDALLGKDPEALDKERNALLRQLVTQEGLFNKDVAEVARNVKLKNELQNFARGGILGRPPAEARRPAVAARKPLSALQDFFDKVTTKAFKFAGVSGLTIDELNRRLNESRRGDERISKFFEGARSIAFGGGTNTEIRKRLQDRLEKFRRGFPVEALKPGGGSLDAKRNTFLQEQLKKQDATIKAIEKIPVNGGLGP